MRAQNNLSRTAILISTLVLIFFSQLASASTPKNTKTLKTSIAGTPPPQDPELSVEAFDKALIEADARGSRTIAVADKITEQALSDNFKTLRNRFVGGPTLQDGKEVLPNFPGVKSVDELHAFLKDLNNDEFYNKLSPDAQFVAAQMAPLIAFHGFFNRSIELMEPTAITHMSTVLGLRLFASSVMVYFPTDQWKVGMEYTTMPSTDMGKLIQNEDDVHEFLETTLIPAIVKMKNRLSKLSFKDKPIYFDNRFFYGTASFFSDRDQYFRIGEAERLTVLANSFYILSSLESLNAYYLNGAFLALDKISKNFGFSSVYFDPKQTSTRKRFDVLKEVGASHNLFKLRDNGRAWMTAAYSSLSWAVINNTIAFRELKKYPSDRDSSLNFMDPRTFMSSFSRIGSGLNNMRYIVVGTGKAGRVQSAVVSNDGRLVSLKNFFDDPPENLVKLMPTGFDTHEYNVTSDVLVNGKPRGWHNFLSGRPVAWSIPDYQKIFPEVRSNSDIQDTARIMAQAWGGWLIGIPMSALVL